MHSSCIVRLNLSKCQLSVGVRTRLCLWINPCSFNLLVSHIENSEPWSDCIVWNLKGETVCPCRTKNKLLCVEIFSKGSANAQREHTSNIVYKYNLSPTGPSTIVSISTRMPGFSATGLGRYVCHFFHFEWLTKLFLLKVLLMDDKLTTIPSRFKR